jgi:hypothetical protein
LGRVIDHSDELGDLRHLEILADNIGSLSSELDAIGKALAAHVIATHGSEEDRAAVIEYLKGWFLTGTFSDR